MPTNEFGSEAASSILDGLTQACRGAITLPLPNSDYAFLTSARVSICTLFFRNEKVACIALPGIDIRQFRCNLRACLSVKLRDEMHL